MIDSLRRAWNRVRAAFQRAPLDTDLDAEIASHLEAAIGDNRRQGMSPEEAHRQALIRFGGVLQAREHHRETRALPWLDVLGQDLRFTLRTLRREPSFALVVMLVLGLGIGANTAVFSVVNTILLRPLSFHEPGQLVWFATNGGKGGLSEQTYTVSAFEEFQRHNRSFQDLTNYQTFFGSTQYKLVGKGDPQPLVGVQVAGNFFPLLGVAPLHGRHFTPEECRNGGPAAALLSYQFWQTQFAGDPGIVGRTISIDASPADIRGPVTVVGVLPESFDFGAVFSPGMKVDLFVPAYADFWRTWGNTLAVIGRLKPGVTVAQAQSEADILFPQLRAMHRNDWWEDYKSTLAGLQDHVNGKLRRTLIVLWSAVGLMLLIVCINVSNLMLARAMSRGKEFAMRTALGAGRNRLVKQLLTESFVLSAGGSALGLLFAWMVTRYLARQGQIALPLLSSVHVDGEALAWTALIAIGVAVLFGLAPAFRVSSGSLQDALKDGGQGMTAGRSHERLRSTLVISEVALACVLLIGAGLLLHSFMKLLDVDLGFAPEHVAAIQVELPYGKNESLRAPMAQNVLDRVRAIPGVEAAGMTDMLPLDRNRSWGFVAKENLNDRKRHGAFVYIVTPGYLEAMGMRLRAGRDISWRDGSASENAIVINEAAARREWPGRDPIGRIARIGRSEVRVVGVIADVRESTLEERAGVQMYIPISQAEPEGTELVVRSRLPVKTIEPSVRSALRGINPGQPRTRFRPIQDIVDHAVSPRRFLVMLITCFAGFGLLLASLGIYGVISYSVSRKSQEIGIRMALGASASRVQFDVIGHTMQLTLIGLAIGAVASAAVARTIASLLFGTEPADLPVFAVMIVLLGAVALLAGHIPARRASRIDPMVVLRGL